jgi:hypothetical protein
LVADYGRARGVPEAVAIALSARYV